MVKVKGQQMQWISCFTANIGFPVYNMEVERQTDCMLQAAMAQTMMACQKFQNLATEDRQWGHHGGLFLAHKQEWS